jgi:hypothetical protein
MNSPGGGHGPAMKERRRGHDAFLLEKHGVLHDKRTSRSASRSSSGLPRTAIRSAGSGDVGGLPTLQKIDHNLTAIHIQNVVIRICREGHFQEAYNYSRHRFSGFWNVRVWRRRSRSSRGRLPGGHGGFTDHSTAHPALLNFPPAAQGNKRRRIAGRREFVECPELLIEARCAADKEKSARGDHGATEVIAAGILDSLRDQFRVFTERDLLISPLLRSIALRVPHGVVGGYPRSAPLNPSRQPHPAIRTFAKNPSPLRALTARLAIRAFCGPDEQEPTRAEADPRKIRFKAKASSFIGSKLWILSAFKMWCGEGA